MIDQRDPVTSMKKPKNPTPTETRVLPYAPDDLVRRRAFPAEAYDYDGEISADDVARLQKQADEILGEGEWEVIDGYAGRK